VSAPLRILYYNWVDYLDTEARGGGVTLYQRNLIEGLEPRDDIEVSFLSAGLSYDLPARAPRWEKLRHGAKGAGVERFEIVNSGVLAPAHHSFGDAAQVSHPATRDVFFDFIARTGPYDVIHFNNLEGLPADVLEIKGLARQTKVVLSLHNYYPVCPQVNLWFAERESCEDFEGGARCVTCLTHQHDARLLRVANGLSYRLRVAGLQPGTWAYDVAFRGILGTGARGMRALRALRRQRAQAAQTLVLDPHRGASLATGFAARRAAMTTLINANCDHVLCVSDAVGRLAVRYGITPALLTTSYIGTLAAAQFEHTAPALQIPKNKTLTLGYLGYMRRDKGFFFLLDALEALPADIAARIRIVVAARAGDPATMARLVQLGGHLAEVIHHDGYTHDDLDAVLAPVDIGVVPVLWHDNLPQVAIEMHARHIPLLTSHMGGASELGRCADMVFEAGNSKDFAQRLTSLLDGKIDMQDYWRGAMAPLTMQGHIAEVLSIYGGDDVTE
jgi:glycosyltransferase involved in cell wall biosynthesis